MAGIQVGGIVSGLDTNAIVDQLMEQAKVPIDRLYGDYEYKKLENDVFSKVNDMLGNVTSDLLSLRLESTFKTKLTSSTNDSVVTATATTEAGVGSHSVTVSQLAKNSIASSSYTRYALSQPGLNVTKISGRSLDYLDAVHKVTVTEEGTDYLSTTETTVSNIGTMSKTAGAALDSADVDAYGELLTDFTGSFTINYTDNNGNAQTLTLTDTFGLATEDINMLSGSLEYAFNEALNEALGTNATQYVSFRAEYDAGTWNMAMYETSVDDHNISIGGTDAGSLRDELGFAEAYTPTTSSTTKMYKYHAGADIQSLQEKMFAIPSGVVVGALYTVTGDIKVGTMTIAQDSSLKVSSNTYTTYTGAAASSGGGIDITAEGLDNAGFAELVGTDTNGKFTINDTVIEIGDYTKLSVNDLLGMINASGAGVVASYDSAEDKFIIRSTTPGSKSIDLGAYGDTSNILDIFKLDYDSNPTRTTGSTSGSIDPTNKLQDCGLTGYPYGGTFTINGVSIYVDVSTESLNDLITKVNKSGAGVTMAYDSTSDKVTMVSDGIDPIEVGSPNDTSTLLQSLNLTDDSTVTKTIGSTGQRAILSVDGTTYIRETNTVDDIITGVTLTLNGASTSAASINVNVDTDKAVEAFAKFVAHYNELMAYLNVPDANDDNEEYMDYLSDAERESMSSDEIATYLENYEKYNTYDIIRRSSELRNMDTTLRKQVFAVRPGINGINDMSDLGIKVAGAGDLDTEFYGYLVELSTDYEEIRDSLKDNTDFMSILVEDPDGVYKFFANSSDNEAELGWARYFNKVISDRYTSNEGMIGGKLGAGGTIFTELADLESRIESQEDRVEKQLERYWAQFTAMEQAIADAQAQSADFSNASGG